MKRRRTRDENISIQVSWGLQNVSVSEAIPLESSYTHIRVFRLIASRTNPYLSHICNPRCEVETKIFLWSHMEGLWLDTTHHLYLGHWSLILYSKNYHSLPQMPPLINAPYFETSSEVLSCIIIDSPTNHDPCRARHFDSHQSMLYLSTYVLLKGFRRLVTRKKKK